MISIDVDPECKRLIKLAAKMLKGSHRRAFMAEVVESLCYGSPRHAETEFGFGRQTVQLGMHEKRTGLICYGNYAKSGKQKAEVASPQLEQDIRALVEPESQAVPQLRNTFAYTRVTAKAVREKLIEEKGWGEEKMIPFGILNLENDQLHVFYGKSYKTSDFICDALEQWWEQVKEGYRHKDELVIYADNGPENNSHRTQFLLRMVEFAKKPD